MLTRRAFLQRIATITAGSAGAVALSRLPIPEDPQHAAFLRGEGPRHFAGARLPRLHGYRLVPDPGTATLRARVDVGLRGYTLAVPQNALLLPHGYDVRFLNDGGAIIETPAGATLLMQSDGKVPPNWTTIAELPTSERVRVAAWDAAMLPQIGQTKGRDLQ